MTPKQHLKKQEKKKSHIFKLNQSCVYNLTFLSNSSEKYTA